VVVVEVGVVVVDVEEETVPPHPMKMAAVTKDAAAPAQRQNCPVLLGKFIR
jgi:hypothetical protein